MSFGLQEIVEKIRITLVVDLTAGVGAVARSIHYMQATANTKVEVGELPFVIFFPVSLARFDTFTSDGMDQVWQFNIIDHADNGILPTDAVMGKLYGNGVPGTSAPTYGLHRRKLSLSTNTMSEMEYLDGGVLFQGDPTAVGMFMQFGVKYEKG